MLGMKKSLATLVAGAAALAFVSAASADNRVSASKKGSVLIYSKVEIIWDAAGNLVQDTVLEISNDYPQDVFVQFYFVNGDAPRDPVFAGDPPMLVAEGEPGWNWVDCQALLTNDQPMYWSANSGLPLGCQPFDILDPDSGSGAGRPLPNGDRVLRGFIYAWAVNNNGVQVRWNHLSGAATLVNYRHAAAWEYNAWAFSALVGSNGQIIGTPGVLSLDGVTYDSGYDQLHMDFYASGAGSLSSNSVAVQVDTDLTLHPINADLRQDSEGPVATKAKFDIWNLNERRFSGTERCIQCWDQELLSNYGNPNTFLLNNLQADKGKARIDGEMSSVCDVNCYPKLPGGGTASPNGYDGPRVCTQYASLLGVVAKKLVFGGAVPQIAYSGRSLVGSGAESAQILWDIIAPPGELRGEAYDSIGVVPADSDRLESATSKRASRASRSE
jgi:hypothetical protein